VKKLLLALLLLPLPAAAGSGSSHEMLDGLSRVMNHCPDRVWPGYRWDKFHVVEITKDGRGYVMAGKTGNIVELAPEQIPESAKISPYAFFKIAGTLGMSINAEVDASQTEEAGQPRPSPAEILLGAIDLAAHEAFHQVRQPSWPERKGARGTLVPIEASPRIYRRALFDRMKEALVDPSLRDEKLGQAKFWFEKWKREFPREAEMSTDLSEGTAQYAGLITMALSELGCSSPENELRERMLKIVTNAPGSFRSGKFFKTASADSFALDSEGYDLGGLATFLLRFDLAQAGWEKKAESGVSPLDLLFAGISARADEFDPALRSQFEAHEKDERKKTDELLAPATDNLAKSDSVVVALPSGWGSGGTYSPHGFFYDPRLNLQYIPLRLPLLFEQENSKVTAGENSVIAVGLKGSPCRPDQAYWTTLVPGESVREDGPAFELTDEYVHGRLRAERKRASDGREWLCGISG
jgi:hypothetical protein